jgi:transcriptional regulator with XRE-family HTH domain
MKKAKYRNSGNFLLADHIKNHIGKKLREKRLEKNYTLQAVATDLGFGKGTMSEIENGIYNLNIEMICILAHYYSIPFDELTSFIKI